MATSRSFLVQAFLLQKQSLSPAIVPRINICWIQQCPYATGGSKRKSKLWFSRTYSPKFNWAPEKPTRSEINVGLKEENLLYTEQKVLERLQTPLNLEQYARGEWSTTPTQTIRGGLVGIKIGVVPQWTVQGRKIMCTMLQILDNHVIDYRPPDEFAEMQSCQPLWKKRGYGMLVVGAVGASPLEFSEEYNELFMKSGVPPKRKLTRFIITENAAIPPGTPLNAQHFRVGDYVDCQSRTIEMGFQGVLTRWGMKGGRASHGVTKAHRRLGSIGGGGDKGGIWRGKKMPGHMGSVWRYLRGMQIVRINTKYNVIYVKGQNIPGPPRSYVRILDTMIPNKRKLLDNNPPPMPTCYPEDMVEETPENIYHESLFDFNNDTVTYEGVDIDNLFLGHEKQYRLYGGCHDGKNHSYRKGNSAH